MVATLTRDSSDLVLGQYTLLEQIGAGGMGRVYAAVHRHMQRQVAIKVLSSHLLDSPAAVQRFEREVRMAAQLTHPHIVTAYDAGEQDGMHYLVMEYVRGADLRSVLARQGPLDRDDALCCVLQASRGLACAHQQGIVHRDVKPGNLLVDREGIVKLLDLGLARLREAGDNPGDEQPPLSASNAVLGTVDFVSPEQAFAPRTVDERSDIYSLGCSLYYLLTGRVIVSGDTPVERLLAHRDAPLPSLREHRPELADELDPLIQRMIAKRPEDRFQTMAHVEQAIQRLLTGTGRLSTSLLATVDELSRGRGLEVGSTIDRSLQPTAAGDVSGSRPGSRAAGEDPPSTVIVPTASRANRRLIWMSAAGLLVLGAAAWIAAEVVFRLETPEGTVVLRVASPGADVLIDGRRELVVNADEGRTTYRISVPPGRHDLKVRAKDGTVFFSREFTAAAGKETELFHAEFVPRARADARAGAAPPAQARAAAAPAAEEGVLLVAQDGSGQFRSIGEALRKARPGTTVRVIDDTLYNEPIQLTSERLHKGLTLEATADATLAMSQPGVLIQITDVPGVRIRGFRLEADVPANPAGQPAGLFAATGNVAGLVLEDLTFQSPPNAPVIGASLEGLRAVEGQPPVTIRRCRFLNTARGVQISGLQNDYKSPLFCRGVAVYDNLFRDNLNPLSMRGAVRDVLVAGNRFVGAKMFAVQFEQLVPSPERLLPGELYVVNNTFHFCVTSIRLWAPSVTGEHIRISSNLGLDSNSMDWLFIDNGGDAQFAKGAGDGRSWHEHWSIDHNWREVTPPEDNAPFRRGWVPAGQQDTITNEIAAIERDIDQPDYLRPAADSPLASGGAGSETESLPKWVGAVPPEGSEAWDWAATWKTLIRRPDGEPR
ncbi:MAG TPA: protein kinase [Planctomycetaceae bacterium]|nr:protein kinase [Planctomycetaceae bacterium]